MKRYFTICIILAFSLDIVCQSTGLLKGLILDKETGNGIPYVSISFDGGRRGTISNVDGNFQLQLRDISNQDSLKFSHLTYVSYTIDVKSLLTGSNQFIYLSQNVHELSEVLITSKTAKEMLRDAMQHIEQNFKSEDHIIRGFYRESMVHPGLDKLLYMAEGSISTKKKGYKNTPQYNIKYLYVTKEYSVVDSGYIAEIPRSYNHLGDNLHVPEIVNGPNVAVSLDPFNNVQLFLSDNDKKSLQIPHRRHEF